MRTLRRRERKHKFTGKRERRDIIDLLHVNVLGKITVWLALGSRSLEAFIIAVAEFLPGRFMPYV